MRTILIFFALLIITMCVYADSFDLSNKKIKISFTETNKHVIVDKIIDPISNENFVKITDKCSPLWIVTVKKAEDIGGEPWNLTDRDAESFSYDKTKDKIVLNWKNVKKSEMVSGFNVTATVTLKGENSYWDIEVSPNKDYGIFEIVYPQIDLDTVNGDELLWPVWCSGRIYKTFDDPKGFPLTKPLSGDYSKDMGYFIPFMTQICSLTKNNVSLYMSPEDKDCKIKSVNVMLNQPNIVTYRFRVVMEDSCKENLGYKSSFGHNFAIVHGDWYNIAKKYRKWGLENNFGVFKLGKLEDRKDLPKWFTENNIYYRLCVDQKNNPLDSLKDLIEKVDMKGIVHVYGYSVYPFDSHYPNWLPMKEDVLDGLKELQDMGNKIMPYTNGHLVDLNLSDTYKKYGNSLINLNEKGDVRHEDYNVKAGTQNVVACPDNAYHEAFVEECQNIMKKMNYDVLYVDQLGMYAALPCYNKEHSHPLGGGDYHIKDYNNIILDLKKSLKEIKGDNVPITTEGSGEEFLFDGWLRLSDGSNDLLPIPINMFIYSDYATNFGTWDNEFEFNTPGEISAINKTAIILCKGLQLGWSIGSAWEGQKAPKFCEHLKRVCKARDSHVKYFTYGEMVRPVNIENNPQKNILYVIGWTKDRCQYYDFPLVKTCSMSLHGKTMVCFSSVSDAPIKVDWNQKAKNLNLKNKKVYNITQTYVNDKKVNKKFASLGKEGEVKSSFTIDPFDTVMFIVE